MWILQQLCEILGRFAHLDLNTVQTNIFKMGQMCLLEQFLVLYVWSTVASWSMRLPPDRAVQGQALVEDIVLCSWARHLTLTVPLSTQVYKWVPANLMLGVTLRWTSIPSLHATETGISSGLMGHLARMQTLPYSTLPFEVEHLQRYQNCFFNP